jgi:hypothetical protein
MSLLIALVLMAFVALIVVSIVNRVQEKEKLRRLQQRKYKIQAEALADVVTCLEQTLPSLAIPKLINEEVTARWQQVLSLETGSRNHLETIIRHTQSRTEDFDAGNRYLLPSYQKDSDAQITQTQVQLTEAGKVLRHLCASGKISDAELEGYLAELSWAYLMVSVASYIGQGYKFSAMHDRFSAQGFYRKAQQLLMESLHPDPRRLRMIKELSELVDGSRSSISRDLIPERMAS